MSTIKQSIRFLPLLALASALSGASLACTANIPVIGRTITPSPTITPTVTNTPTATRTFTPTKTPTPLPTAVAALDWPILMYDTFDNNRYGWRTGSLNDAWLKGTFSISQGKYQIALTAQQPVFYTIFPNLKPLTDFYLAVDVLKASGSTDANYGLYFRAAGLTGYYFFHNTNEKIYGVDLLLKDEWISKKSPVASGKINYGRANRIAVLVKGSRFVFYINGEEIHSMTDAILPRGQAALALTLFAAGDTVDIEVDNFEVRALG
ncbi:MAG: hypothetical protein JW748_09240 [Anaerolineales bacterium]|nr:hypothetical protein [Anaerolineales bacterium]